MTANPILLQRKYARIIEIISKNRNIDLRQTMDLFYKSETYREMQSGISDMHCRSDEYLAEELAMELKR